MGLGINLAARTAKDHTPLPMEPSEKIGVYSIATNLALVGFKALLFFLTGSVALAADAIHSSTDVISSMTVWAGIRISRRKSKNFPYGLYKVENFVSFLSALFIFLAGYEIVDAVFFRTESLKREFLPYGMAGVVITMVVTFAFSRYELRRGKEIGSPSIVADAEHIQTDMLSSGVILAGLLGAFFGLRLDRAAALVVVVLIVRAGAHILLDALRVLLDASIGFETMDRVKTIIMKDPRVESINALRGRNSGPFKFIEADITMNANSLEKAHSVSQRLEKEIRKEVSNVDHILIHYEPRRKETTTCAVPIKEDKSSISEHFGDAPYFYIAKRRENDGTLLSEGYYQNPFVKEEKGKGIKVSNWLLENGVDVVYSPKGFEGRGPGYVFSDAGVEVVVMENQRLEEIRQDFQKIGD